MSKDENTRELSSDAESGNKPRAKAKHNKIVAVVAVVVVVAVAAVGFNAWHATPEFCGAICHTPMDAYVFTYTEGNTDKYGNALDESQAKGMMAYMHKTVANESGNTAAACLDCHEPTIGEQVTEGIHWVTGDFEVAGENANGDVILYSRTYDQLTEARGSNAEGLCLNSRCHVNADGSVMQRSDLEEATAELSATRNPHWAQHGAVDCGTCHKGHSQSLNYCSQCHEDAPIPEGWLSYYEAEQLGIV